MLHTVCVPRTRMKVALSAGGVSAKMMMARYRTFVACYNSTSATITVVLHVMFDVGF